MADYTAQCSSNQYITLLLRTQVVSQDVGGNTTTLNWSLHVLKSGASTSATWGNCSYGATINGNAYSDSGQVRVEAGGDTVLLTGTTTVPHNADGTKTVSLSASISGKIVGSLSASETLATIPRASSFVSIPTFTLGTAGTITIKKSEASFKHRITYWFGSAKGNCDSTYWSGTTLTWTPPTTLANQIPNAASGTGTLTLYTYDASGKQIGTVTAPFTAQLPTSMAPSISAVTAAEATAGLSAKFGAYVQGKSTLKVVTSAAGSYGSAVRSCTVSVDGKTYAGTDITTSVITGSGTLSITASVTDSRGRTASKSITISVQPYANPAITALSVWRCTADGAADDSGDYVGITYAYTIASVNSKNDASAKIEYKRNTASSWSSLLTNSAYAVSTTIYPAQEMLSDYQWDIRLTVSDYFGSTTMTATLPSAEVILDLLASGNGLGIGKTAEQADLLDVKWHTRIWGGLEVQGNSAINGLLQVGQNLQLRTDGEGGNIRIGSPDQYNRHWEMDSYNGNFRLYTMTNDNTDYKQISVDTDGNIHADGFLYVAGNLITDFIISNGVSGNWHYWKWYSGLAICIHNSINCGGDGNYYGSAWGSIYSSNDYVFSAYPFTFAGVPSVFASRTSADNSTYNGYQTFIALSGGTQTTPPTASINRGTAVTIGHPKLSLVAIGRWR